MGGKDKHSHHHHGHDLPKGCMAIKVGREEEQQRFVVPVVYLKHPQFQELLRESAEEYGFRHEGPITLPCGVDQFRQLQGKIDGKLADGDAAGCGAHHHHHHQQPGHHHHHHLHFHMPSCFGAS